jgi:hypothetical protein
MHADSVYDDAPLGVEALAVLDTIATDCEPAQRSPRLNWSLPGAYFVVMPSIEHDEWNLCHEREALRQLGRVLGLDC